MPAALFGLALMQVSPTATAPAMPTSDTYWGLKASEWIMIAAIILGPILAVVTQLWWQHYKQRRDQKLWVFGTLMTNRATITPDFVKALNFIDVVFYKNEVVRGKGKKLLTHLSSDAYKAQPIAEATLEHTRDLLAELLVEMAKELGFGYDFTHIKENAYYPTALGTADAEQVQLRQKLIAALDGKGTLSVHLVEDGPAPATMPAAVTSAKMTPKG